MWLAQQGRPKDSMNPIEMLCFIDFRGMGALEFKPPAIKENLNTFSAELDTLVNVSQKMLYQRESFLIYLIE